MNAATCEELQTLLNEALKTVVIQRGNSAGLMPVREYKILRNRCATEYDPQLHRYVYCLSPDVSNSTIRERLLELLRRELSEFLHCDRIMSATIAFAGGHGGGSPVGDLIVNLVKRTIMVGSEAAVRELERCITGKVATFQRYHLLTGIHIENSRELLKGISLIRLPGKLSDLPSHLPETV